MGWLRRLYLQDLKTLIDKGKNKAVNEVKPIETIKRNPEIFD